MKAGRAGATGAAGADMAAPVLAPSPDISKPTYVVGTSNSLPVSRSALPGDYRRMRVQILTHATEGAVFLVTFPDAKVRGC